MALGARPDLVIFDCDGVLVDSEPLANALLKDALEDLGLKMAHGEVRATFVGRSWASVIEIIESRIGRGVPDGWRERLAEREHAVFKKDLQPIPHVGALVETLRAQRIRYCVASSGSIDKMHLTLGVTGLLPFFENVLFSASMVERGKPHPDLFLHAAAAMETAPSRCVVIEDSVAGTTGAKAAGMAVLAYAGDPLADREGLAAAGGILFEDMRDVPGLISLTEPYTSH